MRSDGDCSEVRRICELVSRILGQARLAVFGRIYAPTNTRQHGQFLHDLPIACVQMYRLSSAASSIDHPHYMSRLEDSSSSFMALFTRFDEDVVRQLLC